jgi:L-fuconolactonase
MVSKIIDTHLHVWDFNYANYDWLKGNESILNRNFFVEEIDNERQQAGVVSAVLVQAANNFGDTDRMLDIANITNWVAGVVGWLPLKDPDATARALTQKYLLNNYFKGVRHLINDEADERWLLQDEVIESLGILAGYSLPYDVVGIVSGHIKTALAVAERVPGLRMVFDHLNQPPIKSKQFGIWGELMKEAALHTNFYVKISGLGTASGNLRGWTEEDLFSYIEFALDHFGENRCFCGSDWPVSLLAGSYVRHWHAYKNILQYLLNDVQLEKVLFSNARRFYDLSGNS